MSQQDKNFHARIKINANRWQNCHTSGLSKSQRINCDNLKLIFLFTFWDNKFNFSQKCLAYYHYLALCLMYFLIACLSQYSSFTLLFLNCTSRQNAFENKLNGGRNKSNCQFNHLSQTHALFYFDIWSWIWS